MVGTKDKRKHIRHNITGIRNTTAEKAHRGIDSFEIKMFDLSAGGAGFGSHEKLEEGETVSFFFSLPGSEDKRVGARGVIVRVDEDENDSDGTFYKYGLKILNFITENEVEEIHRAFPKAAEINTAEKNVEIKLSLRESEVYWLNGRAREKKTTPSQIVSELITGS